MAGKLFSSGNVRSRRKLAKKSIKWEFVHFWPLYSDFRSIFGGLKWLILILKTLFVQNAKKSYFGSEKNSKNARKISFFRKVRKYDIIVRKVIKSQSGWFWIDLEHFFSHFLKWSKSRISQVYCAKISCFHRF